MAFQFGDGFDLYAAPADAINGYWDSAVGIGSFALIAGRFAGSQALNMPAAPLSLVKSSGVNDAVHHFVVAFRQTGAISGSTLGGYLELFDGATAQCSVVFRGDGAILLTSGGPTGTTLATYTGAFPVANTWYAFEFEVVINNTTGAFRIRKNGNSVNDFDSGNVLNTRGGTANNYANRLQPGLNSATGIGAHQFDDLYWRSDAASVPWMGDIRCYTRMPASDASVQFSRTPTSYVQGFAALSSTVVTAGRAFYSPFTAQYDGTFSSGTVSFVTGYTGNLKTTIFASSGGVPTTVIGSANVIVNPATGSNVLTFGTTITVTKGVQYWIGFDSDTTSGSYTGSTGGASSGWFSTTAYASFPVASPASLSAGNPILFSLALTVTSNASTVAEPQQDATTSYVYDSTVNDADFYGIASIASTPVATIAVTTRGYMQKSDAGTRTAAVQLKSGSATVASPTLVLTTSGWLWTWRTDTVDPNTSAAWTAAAVNNAQVGPKVIA